MKKKYIGVVDGIVGGEGNGPLDPDAKDMGYLICGLNPVAIDVVCARLMGFDPQKILVIQRAFQINKYRVCDFVFDDIEITVDARKYKISDIPDRYIIPFKPHRAWNGHIEWN